MAEKKQTNDIQSNTCLIHNNTLGMFIQLNCFVQLYHSYATLKIVYHIGFWSHCIWLGYLRSGSWTLSVLCIGVKWMTASAVMLYWSSVHLEETDILFETHYSLGNGSSYLSNWSFQIKEMVFAWRVLARSLTKLNGKCNARTFQKSLLLC